MNESMEAPTDTGSRRYLRANVLAVPLACLTLAGCLSAGSNQDVSAEVYASAPAISAAPSVESTPTDALPESYASSENTSLARLAGCEPYFSQNKYLNHEYEVCTAYVVNSAEIALQAFYKFGNSRISYLSNGARHHFETRYFGDARQTIESAIDAWPKVRNLTGNKVDMKTTVLSLASNLKADRAILQTQERLRVTEKSGAVLLNEASHAKDVTMCRGGLPGHPLHEWFVVSYSREPDFDCIGFDKANSLRP